MVNIRLESINDSFLGLDAIKQINADSFPSDEKLPIDGSLLFVKEGLAKIFAICEDVNTVENYNYNYNNSTVENKNYNDAIENNNNVVGFVSIIFGDKLDYMAHLAIDSRLRGKGYGTEALNLLKQEVGEDLFFLVESLDEDAINYDERISRVNFYEKLGFKLYDDIVEVKAGPMNIMGTDGLSSDLILNEIEIIFGHIVDFAVKNKDFIIDCYKKDNFDLESLECFFKYYETHEYNSNSFKDFLKFF